MDGQTIAMRDDLLLESLMDGRSEVFRRGGRGGVQIMAPISFRIDNRAAVEVSSNDGSVSQRGRDCNVFRDLGFSAGEAEHLLVRADLLIQLQKALSSRGLTQAKAAKILRVTQPRVSDLLRGRIDLFSTDSLIDMLARLGVHVRFVLKPSRRRVA